MLSLAETLGNEVEMHLRGRPIKSVPALEIHTLVHRVLAREVGVRERDLDHLASLLSTTFLGLPPEFSPRRTLAACDKNSLERLEYVMDERGDGSEGAFVFVQLSRAERDDKHVPGKPWEFIRHNRNVGEARFFLKEKMRSGDALVVVGLSFGEPDLSTYVDDLAVDVAAHDGCISFPASTVPGFEEYDLRQALRPLGLYLYEEKRPVPGLPRQTQRYYTVEKR